MKRGTLAVLLLLLCAAITILPLLTIHGSEFGGADGAAEEVVAEIHPDYTPWAESVLEPPGGETETLLFCLQAALGGCVIGACFGYFFARNKYGKEV